MGKGFLKYIVKPRLHEQCLFDNFPRQIRLLVYMMQQICFDSTQKISFKSDAKIAQSLANVQINTCDKYVTRHIHEQMLVIYNFCLPHKN